MKPRVKVRIVRDGDATILLMSLRYVPFGENLCRMNNKLLHGGFRDLLLPLLSRTAGTTPSGDNNWEPTTPLLRLFNNIFTYGGSVAQWLGRLP